MRIVVRLLVFVFLVSLLQSCRYISRSKKYRNAEDEKITDCRRKWKFRMIEDKIELKLIYFTPKRSYTMVSYPNFFIGTTADNDTIGVIDYFSRSIFEKNSNLVFYPEIHGGEISKELASMRNKPIFYTSRKRKENDLQCAVNTIYYGRVVEE